MKAWIPHSLTTSDMFRGLVQKQWTFLTIPTAYSISYWTKLWRQFWTVFPTVSHPYPCLDTLPKQWIAPSRWDHTIGTILWTRIWLLEHYRITDVASVHFSASFILISREHVRKPGRPKMSTSLRIRWLLILIISRVVEHNGHPEFFCVCCDNSHY